MVTVNLLTVPYPSPRTTSGVFVMLILRLWYNINGGYYFMSLAKPTEIDEALENKARFDGFVTDAPNALNLVNERIDNEIERATGAEQALDNKINDETTARTQADQQFAQDIEELTNNINGQIQSINDTITALENRITALEQKETGGQ